jgi:hypothetical protein
MTIEQAGTFLIGSVLVMLAILVIVATTLLINTLLSKFWKPVRIFTADSFQGYIPTYPYPTQPVAQPTDLKKTKEVK